MTTRGMDRAQLGRCLSRAERAANSGQRRQLVNGNLLDSRMQPARANPTPAVPICARAVTKHISELGAARHLAFVDCPAATRCEKVQANLQLQ